MTSKPARASFSYIIQAYLQFTEGQVNRLHHQVEVQLLGRSLADLRSVELGNEEIDTQRGSSCRELRKIKLPGVTMSEGGIVRSGKV